MITFHPGHFARECPESEAEAVIEAAPNATHATGDYYNIKRAGGGEASAGVAFER